MKIILETVGDAQELTKVMDSALKFDGVKIMPLINKVNACVVNNIPKEGKKPTGKPALVEIDDDEGTDKKV
jgi:hypothetical protein